MRALISAAALLSFALAWALVPSYASSPAGQARPLPDTDTFYAAVRENLTRAERETHLFTYKERRTNVHTNPFGRLGTGGTNLYEVYPSPMRQLMYRRLVQRDGKPLSAAELAEQDREYRARVSGVQQEHAARTADEKLHVEQQSKEARGRRQRAMEDVVNTLQFQIKGRTTVDGVQAIEIAFSPKPGASPTTRQGRMAQRFVGSIWVDEAASEVMRVEAKSIGDISYGYGIVARLGEGTTATVRRKPIGHGLWMPTELTLAGKGRAVVFRRLVVDYSIEWFDYRRLPQESLTPFLDARVESQPNSGPQ